MPLKPRPAKVPTCLAAWRSWAGEAEAPTIGKEVEPEGMGADAGALDGILDSGVPQVVSRSQVGGWSVFDLRMAVLHAGTPQHLQSHGQPFPAAELRLPAAKLWAGCLIYGAPDDDSAVHLRRRRCEQQRAGIRSVVAQLLIFQLSFCRYPPSKTRRQGQGPGGAEPKAQ